MPPSPSSAPLGAQPFLRESHRKTQLTRSPYSSLQTLTFAQCADSVPALCAWPASGPWSEGWGGLPGACAEPAPRALPPQFLCTVVAILLHYVYTSTFAWTFVEGLHVYRMLTEVRNIDAGPMRFYYVVGWGIPAIITGEDWRNRLAGEAWAWGPPLRGQPP